MLITIVMIVLGGSYLVIDGQFYLFLQAGRSCADVASIVVLIASGTQNIAVALYVLWSFSIFGALINGRYLSCSPLLHPLTLLPSRSRNFYAFALASLALSNASNDARSRDDTHPTRSSRNDNQPEGFYDRHEEHLRYRIGIDEIPSAWSQGFSVRLRSTSFLLREAERVVGWEAEIGGGISWCVSIFLRWIIC